MSGELAQARNRRRMNVKDERILNFPVEREDAVKIFQSICLAQEQRNVGVKEVLEWTTNDFVLRLI